MGLTLVLAPVVLSFVIGAGSAGTGKPVVVGHTARVRVERQRVVGTEGRRETGWRER